MKKGLAVAMAALLGVATMGKIVRPNSFITSLVKT